MNSNPLTDLIPAQYRKYVYVVAAAALFVYGLYVAANGDWKTFAVALLSALVPSMAASNTSTNSDYLNADHSAEVVDGEDEYPGLEAE